MATARRGNRSEMQAADGRPTGGGQAESALPMESIPPEPDNMSRRSRHVQFNIVAEPQINDPPPDYYAPPEYFEVIEEVEDWADVYFMPQTSVGGNLYVICLTDSEMPYHCSIWKAICGVLSGVVKAAFLLTFICLILKSVSAQDDMETYQYCGIPKTGLYMAFPTKRDCRSPDLTKVKNGTVTVYVPSTNMTKIDAVRCSRQKTTYYNTNSLFGQGTPSRQFTSVTVDECKQMVEDFYFDGQFFVDKGDGLWITEPDTSRGFELFGQLYTVTSYVIYKGLIGTRDGVRLSSNLGDVAGCRVDAGFCVNDQMVIMWDRPNFTELNYHEARGTYTALIGNDSILIEHLQAVFFFAKHGDEYAQRFFGQNAKKMENDIIVVIHNMSDTVIVREKRSTSLLDVDDVEEVDPGNEDGYSERSPLSKEANARLSYVEGKLRQFGLLHLDEIWKRVCHIYNRQVEITRTMAKIDPTQAVRMWIRQKNITATIAGDVFIIAQCIPVRVKHVFLNHQLNGTCYMYQPVVTDYNATLFVVPGGRDLVSSSEEIACDQQATPVHYVDGEYRNYRGRVIVQEPPDYLLHGDSRLPSVKFNAPAVFQSELTGVINVLGLLTEQQRRLHDLERHFDSKLRRHQIEHNLRGLRNVAVWFTDIEENVKGAVNKFIADWGFLIRLVCICLALMVFLLALPGFIIITRIFNLPSLPHVKPIEKPVDSERKVNSSSNEVKSSTSPPGTSFTVTTTSYVQPPTAPAAPEHAYPVLDH